jgi:hypothetical protein
MEKGTVTVHCETCGEEIAHIARACSAVSVKCLRCGDRTTLDASAILVLWVKKEKTGAKHE